MKVDFRKMKHSLKPLIHSLRKLGAKMAAFLPKFPDLSWNFFILEEGTWIVYNPSRFKRVKYEDDVKQLDKSGLWIRLIPWKYAFHQDLKIPFQQASKRQELIPFQMEPLLPFSVDLAELSHLASKAETIVWVCAIQKKDIAAIQKESSEEGISCEGFISPLFALMKAHAFYFPNETDPILYFQKEAERLVLVLVDHKKIWGIRQIDLKGQSLSDSLLELETRRTLIFLQTSEVTKRFWLGKEPEFLSSHDLFEKLEEKDHQEFLLKGAKLLMESSCRYDAVISNKQASLLTKISPWVKGWILASSALFMALLLQTSCFYFKESHYQKNLAEKIIRQAEKQHIELASLKEFDSVKKWSEEMEAFIQNKISPYPLQADLPSVKDTLTWASNILVSAGNASITSFEYKSESFPDSKHVKARYRVKVELEIEAYDPSVAEAIQQKFLKSYDWIEKPSALIWRAQKDRYQVSFYLRDKTRYVQ